MRHVLASPTTLLQPGRSATDLARFFVDSACGTTDYISHGEIACGRAVSGTEWSPDVLEVVRDEIRGAVTDVSQMKRVWYAEDDDGIAALAIVDLSDAPLASFDDMVVRSGGRSGGVGAAFYRAIIADLRTIPGFVGVMCESGLNNHGAHAFIERCGFRPVSKVFYLDFGTTR